MSVLSNGWPLAFGFGLGPMEMLVFLGVALLLYGGKLPEAARSWGKSLAEFRRSMSGIQSEINDVMYQTPTQHPDQLGYHPEATSYSDYSEDVQVESEDATQDEADSVSTIEAASTEDLSPEEHATEKRHAPESD